MWVHPEKNATLKEQSLKITDTESLSMSEATPTPREEVAVREITMFDGDFKFVELGFLPNSQDKVLTIRGADMRGQGFNVAILKSEFKACFPMGMIPGDVLKIRLYHTKS